MKSWDDQGHAAASLPPWPPSHVLVHLLNCFPLPHVSCAFQPPLPLTSAPSVIVSATTLTLETLHAHAQTTAAVSHHSSATPPRAHAMPPSHAYHRRACLAVEASCPPLSVNSHSRPLLISALARSADSCSSSPSDPSSSPTSRCPSSSRLLPAWPTPTRAATPATRTVRR